MRIYYKYQYEDWTQPVLTSNTSYGTVSASSVNQASTSAYKVLDNDTSTQWETAKGVKAAWLNWELKEEIIITGLSLTVRNGDRPIITARVYTDSTKATPIGDSITTTTAGETVVVQNIPEDGVITSNIYIDCTSTQDYLGLAELVITAKKQTGVIESTEDDYDYYVDVLKQYAPTLRKRRFYKNLYKYYKDGTVTESGKATVKHKYTEKVNAYYGIDVVFSKDFKAVPTVTASTSYSTYKPEVTLTGFSLITGSNYILQDKDYGTVSGSVSWTATGNIEVECEANDSWTRREVIGRKESTADDYDYYVDGIKQYCTNVGENQYGVTL